ncbi:hypothetical protein HQ487_04310 [Candidatus Uhrbacteria bacterium]|nr:hypothetical protein [Candidatus Uhrbacteria bacterium]
MAIESKMNRGPIGRPQQGGERKKLGGWGVITILLFIALIGGAWFYFRENQLMTTDSSTGITQTEGSQEGGYQAVFLDNGQVYFGKLEQTKKDFYILTDVYYLQSGIAIDQDANLSLMKLGSEAHGPKDRMEINVSHILFYEDMKDDSKVVQAIQQYTSNK